MKTCTLTGNSRHDQSPSANIYRLPRFRVSLVRENRAAAPSLPIATPVCSATIRIAHPSNLVDARQAHRSRCLTMGIWYC